jgi:hypothetical protein
MAAFSAFGLGENTIMTPPFALMTSSDVYFFTTK